MHLQFSLWIGDIDHMNDIVRIFRFFQRTLKRLYEMMRQFADKSYCICQKNLLPVLQLQYTCRWIQRGKKLIFCQDTGSGQCIQQGRLPGIRIAYDCGSLKVASASLTTDQLSVLLHLRKLCFQSRDPGTDQTSVCLQLFLTRSSRTDTTAKSGQ